MADVVVPDNSGIPLPNPVVEADVEKFSNLERYPMYLLSGKELQAKSRHRQGRKSGRAKGRFR